MDTPEGRRRAEGTEEEGEAGKLSKRPRHAGTEAAEEEEEEERTTTAAPPEEDDEDEEEDDVGEVDTELPCPCCGCLTFSGRGMYDICPVCFWEDEGTYHDRNPDEPSGANHGLTLTVARANYAAIGACSPSMLPHVRPPQPTERVFARTE